jgi:hypothetical protein
MTGNTSLSQLICFAEIRQVADSVAGGIWGHLSISEDFAL